MRFVPIDDEIKITLKAPEGTISRPIVYYGSIQSGYQNLFKNVYDTPTEIVIPKSGNYDFVKKSTQVNNLPFSPDVIRVVLSNGEVEIGEVKGKCRPPKPCELPQKTYLAYGSSITHGSLGMVQPNTYVSRVGEYFKADVINLGFAGNAKLENCVAEHIAKNCEFDFATLEMGVNILNISCDEYRKRAENFIGKIAKAHSGKKIFCIDVFYMIYDLIPKDGTEGKQQQFRNILKDVVSKLKLPDVVYINGLDLLSGSYGLSEDGTHPNARGMEEISANLVKIMEKYIC